MKILKKIKGWFVKESKVAPLWQNIPNNLDEAIASMEANMTEKDKEYLKNNLGKDPWIHMGFGRNLRNNWQLWQEGTPLRSWFESIGIHHPDDMSAIINDSFVKKQRGEPINLDAQIQYYQNYWSSMNKEATKCGKGGFAFKMNEDGTIQVLDDQLDK